MPPMNNDSPSILSIIESAAHDGAFGDNPLPSPTEAQCKAGNYKVGRAEFLGFKVSIEQPRGSYRSGTDANGNRWVSRMAAHYGYFTGTRGKDGDPIDVFIGPWPAADTAYIINQYVGGQFDEHKVMLGYPDEASARQSYFDSYDRGWDGLHGLVPATLQQLRWWLANGDHSRPVRPEHLPYAGTTMTQRIYWDSANGLPADMTLPELLYRLRRAEDGDLLLDSVSVADIMEDADEVLIMDALTTPFAKAGAKMEVLKNVMDRAGGGKLKVNAVQITDPFTSRGVANVAAIFELSDGQTVSVYLHNPDVSPKKIQPSDELISWKWLLNKKDITIVVAPERGADLNVREVARRIMVLAAKNSDAFARANRKRAAAMQEITQLTAEISTLELELEDAKRENEVVRQELDDWTAAKAAVPVPEAVLPWDGASVEDETRWFGTKVEATIIAPAYTRKGPIPPRTGILHSVKNGGSALEIKFDGDDFSTRIDAKSMYRVEVLNLVDSKQEDPIPDPDQTQSESYIKTITDPSNPDVEAVLTRDAQQRFRVTFANAGVEGTVAEAVLKTQDEAEKFAAQVIASGVYGSPLLPEGRENTVKTAKGAKVATGFAVVEAARLITSHDAAGNPNPGYPQELQPRDRARATSQAWVLTTAKNLDPDSLGRTTRADSGAPIVGPDRVVESGNGRTMAITEAYRRGWAGEYRAWLEENAEYFGISASKIKSMKAPVLVRVRTSDVDRAAFAVEANQDDKLAMTATEKARSDAKRLDDAMLAKLTADGDLLNAGNRAFLSAFLQSLGDAEAAQYMTSTGAPTASLIARVQAAIFAKAYADDRLLELTADTAKPEVANILNALNVAAPDFVRAMQVDRVATEDAAQKLTDGIEASLTKQATDAIVGAVNVLNQAKTANMSVDEFVRQTGMFGDVPAPVAAMALFISKNNRSAKRMGSAFKAMAEFIQAEASRRSAADMFGEQQPVFFADIVAAGNRRLELDYG